MIAIVKVGGHQALIKAGELLEVDKISLEVGKKIELETLLVSEEDGSNFQLGAPFLSQKVSAKVIEHGRGEKIRIYKMKPRKRYRRTQGHRQDYTLIEILPFAEAEAKPKVKKVAKKEVTVS